MLLKKQLALLGIYRLWCCYSSFVVEVDAVTSLNLSPSRMVIILETDNSNKAG